MTKKKGSLEKLAYSAMKLTSRRGFLKTVGAISAALMGNLFGFSKYALAYIPCPAESEGICNDCYSYCISGGMYTKCVCDNCDCIPPLEAAICAWDYNGKQCIWSGACVACSG